MSSVFDGLAGILTGVLGSPDIIWLPVGLEPVTVASLFRRMPVEVPGPDGEPVLAMTPVWRVPLDPNWAREPQRGDRVQPGDGHTYRILSVQPSGSPAVDRFLLCALERLP